jgi:integrase
MKKLEIFDADVDKHTIEQSPAEVYSTKIEQQEMMRKLLKLLESERLESESDEILEGFIDDIITPWSEQNHRDSIGFLRRVERLKKRYGSMRLCDIRKKHIMILLNEIAPTVQSPTLGKYQSAFSRVFSLAIAMDYLDKNPVQGLPRPKNNPPKTRVLELIELSVAIDYLVSDSNQVQALAILLCLFTGLRQGNVISIQLTWFANNFHILNVPVTKSGKPQQIALNSTAVSIVKEALKYSDGVFLYPAKTGSGHITKPTTCMERLRNHMKDRGVLNGHFTCHDLRRCYASYQLRTCGDIRLVQQSLGHADCKTTQIYTYHADERLLEASEQTASALLNGSELTFKRNS